MAVVERELRLKVGAKSSGFVPLADRLNASGERTNYELLEATRDSTAELLAQARTTINRSGKADSERPPERPYATHERIFSEVERDPGGKITGRVFTNDPVALILERGSKAHSIEPKIAQALRFRIGPRIIFARRVNHPGTRPYRWLARAFANTEALRRQRYRRAVESVMDFLGGRSS